MVGLPYAEPYKRPVGKKTFKSVPRCRLVLKKKQGEPGNGIVAVLESQTQVVDHGDDIDAVAFHAGMHPVGVVAGLSVQPGAALALGAGLCGQHIGLHTLGPEQIPDLVGDPLVGRPGGQGFVDVGDVRNLGGGGDHQTPVVAPAPGLAQIHRTHSGGTGPAFVVHGAFVLADPPDPVGKLQLFGVKKLIHIQRQLQQLRFQTFLIQHNSSKIVLQPSSRSFHVAEKSPVYQGSATS